jgi:hypothetical protein
MQGSRAGRDKSSYSFQNRARGQGPLTHGEAEAAQSTLALSSGDIKASLKDEALVNNAGKIPQGENFPEKRLQ